MFFLSHSIFSNFIQADVMKESMLYSIRVEAGLGDPPNEYTTNDVEAENFMIKHRLEFNPHNPIDFIKRLKELIDLRFRNDDRAIFDKGSYKLNGSLKHLAVNHDAFGQMTHEQRVRKIEVFREARLESKANLLNVEDPPDGDNGKLSVSAADCQVNSVLFPVLEIMFDRANNLLAKNDFVIPKPGAIDGSYNVAAKMNRVFTVTTGQGGLLRCDKACTNKTTIIYQHVLAVVEKRVRWKSF